MDGWTPVFDDAVIATRSFDVFSAHSPLVGTYSDASLPSVGSVYGAGPLLYWLLAVQVRFLGDWALPVTMGVVNTASIMGVVAQIDAGHCARRCCRFSDPHACRIETARDRSQNRSPLLLTVPASRTRTKSYSPPRATSKRFVIANVGLF